MESFYDGVETVTGFCYFGDRLNANGGCGMAVTARARLGWVKFRECGELLHGKKVFTEYEGKDISILCAISYALW